MGSVNIRPFLSYLFVVVLIFTGMAVIILPLLEFTERIMGLCVLLGGLIVFLVLIMNVFEKYIKPIQSAARVADELVQGNYKARTYVSYFGEAGKLSNSINVLARSLQQITLQEKMQENQMSTVIDNMESGLMLIDEKGYVHMVNRKFLSIFGSTEKDYLGFLYYDVLDTEKIHKAVQEAFLYEEKVKVSFSITSGLERKAVETVGAPIFNDKRELKGAVLVFHDITEMKRLEEMRKDFVANVSHELKTPITSIKGFAETLLEGAMEDTEIRRQFLEIILKESGRLQTLIHDLLELSKLEKEELRLEYKEVNVPSVVHDLLPVVKQQADKKQIELTVDLPDHLKAVVDEERLKQVLINLLNNAVNYTQEQGKVALSVFPNVDKLKITVTDTGIGVPEKAQSRIFERFYRVDKARSRNTGGTGLGLAIVKHIVEAHKGSIYLDSKVNEGTVFTIELPLKPEHF
ncbi:two-component system histidine kinase PnpS [Sediminibacillus halophilus]|uniref:histidine kinase n=1 Tax=Sediminibacillus halophilus TaxID=482461 RepID=A0A1G9Y9S3_9BACI|nr:ATP-binding protein [Sediminibacillus halophilus]SDN05787.1 two-component system, OmpR family, phosphate regulon sensor histidine kinase PhoR [Sediminibacillus halophilus]